MLASLATSIDRMHSATPDAAGSRPAGAPRLLHERTRMAMSATAQMMALRAPLLLKLVGANLLLVGAVAAVALAAPLLGWSTAAAMTMVAGAVIANLLLVVVALRPLRGIELVARRVWRGDFGARVGISPVADRDVARIGNMFNLLLDGLSSDKARMRQLATQMIEAGERERAVLARELHESTAQQLAGIVLQLGAAARAAGDTGLVAQLDDIRDATGAVLEEVRLLAKTVHPRVLEDLGLPAALKQLARDATAGSQVEIEVDAGRVYGPLAAPAAAVLYRVAQSAVHNVMRHAEATNVQIALSVGGGEATLVVQDDGRGFDVAEAEQRRPGMGLFTMRQRIALVGGRFEVRSAPGAGTRVTAVVSASGAPEPLSPCSEDASHE